MGGFGLNLWQACLALLEFVLQGAVALPLIMVLGLIFGRRGNGAFCLWAVMRLGRLTLWLAFAGSFYFLGSYLVQTAGNAGASCFGVFFSLAGMNYSLGLAVWLCGLAALCIGWLALRADAAAVAGSQDKYRLKDIKSAIFFLLLAFFCYFLTLLISHWPFAGYPAGISRERALMAILRNAARGLFMALSPAGAFACVLAAWHSHKGAEFSDENILNAVRWSAFWAFAGYLPATLQNLGLLLGAGAGAYMNFAAAYYTQLCGAIFTVAGLVCFAFLLVRKKSPPWLAYLGIILFVCAKMLPKILFRQIYNL